MKYIALFITVVGCASLPHGDPVQRQIEDLETRHRVTHDDDFFERRRKFKNRSESFYHLTKNNSFGGPWGKSIVSTRLQNQTCRDKSGDRQGILFGPNPCVLTYQYEVRVQLKCGKAGFTPKPFLKVYWKIEGVEGHTLSAPDGIINIKFKAKKNTVYRSVFYQATDFPARDVQMSENFHLKISEERYSVSFQRPWNEPLLISAKSCIQASATTYRNMDH